MAKKLFIVWLSITMVTFSSISIYAKEQTQGDFFIPKTSLDMNDDDASISVEEEEESRTMAAALAVAAEKAAKEEIRKEQEQRYQAGLAGYIRSVNNSISKEDASNMAAYFIKYADRYDVDVKIVMAIAQNESCYYRDVVSCEDFKGLMQTGDGLARNAGYKPQELFNPEISIKVGARYLSIKMKEFGNMRLALTAYNQGSGSVHSGNYSTAYADTAMSRAADMEKYLKDHGYVE